MKRFYITFLISISMVSLHAQNIGISNDNTFTTPQSPLHIYWTSDGNLLQLSRSNAGNTGLTFSVSSNDYSILNRENNALIFGTNATERMRITNTGNVGIGTNVPAAQLHTTGTVRFAGYTSGANGAILRTNSSGDLSITNFSGTANDVLLGTGAFGSMNSLAWQLTGNSGLTDGTNNFLGTTSAVPLKFVTNGTANVRMTIAAAGTIGVNVAPSTSYQLYASSTLAVAGNATIYGESTGSAQVYGVLGTASGNVANASGVRGYASGATAATNGVWGEAASSSGSGVYGLATHANGYGVYGYNSAAAGAGTGAGVYGISRQTGVAGVVGNGSTSTRGVLGINNNDTYAAVQAQNANADGDALFAFNAAANGSGTGTAIWAYSRQTGASTIVAGLRSWGYFANAAISGTTDASISNGIGIIGACDNANGVGVQGQSAGTNGVGVFGTSSGASGSGGHFQNTNNSGTGIIGGGNNLTPSYLTSGSGGAFTGDPYGIAAFKNGALTNNEGAGWFIASTTSNVGVAIAYRSGNTNYKIVNIGGFGGQVSTDVWGLTNDTNDRKIMFCPEAPEILLQDYGQGELINGRAHIELDPIFSRNIVVNDEHPLRVFIQLEGDCNGVYVTNKTKNGFDVIELQNGKSNVKFTWFVTANRADYINPITNELISKHEGVRFPQAPNPEKIERLPERKYGGLCIPQAPKSEKIESLRVRNYENEKLKKVEK